NVQVEGLAALIPFGGGTGGCGKAADDRTKKKERAQANWLGSFFFFYSVSPPGCGNIFTGGELGILPTRYNAVISRV
ncbi:MAG TPA: hypothetical protein PKD91_05845, partial [Bacteroidia bacterium]|nr:hypothetical protein [Bacteroidia bacterium]